jgi:hypothetical protein
MWISKRNRGALPLPMSEVDYITDSTTAMYVYYRGNLSFFLGGKSPSDDYE